MGSAWGLQGRAGVRTRGWEDGLGVRPQWTLCALIFFKEPQIMFESLGFVREGESRGLTAYGVRFVI